MKSIRAKIMWLLFGSVLIASLIIGTVCTLLTVMSRVMRKIDSGIWQKSITRGRLNRPLVTS